MTKETEIIKLAKTKNGRDFDKWLEETPSKVADIIEVRKITEKISYSMVKETST